MQHMKPFLFLIPLAAMVTTATAETSAEVAARRLSDALTREIATLTAVNDAESAAAAVPKLQALLDELAAMDRSYEAEKALWAYIDNTEGVKRPFIELIQRLATQFTRLEVAEFYGNGELRSMLSPQVIEPEKKNQGTTGE